MKKISSIAACLVLALCFASTADAALQQVRVLGVGVDHSSAGAEAKAVDYAKKRAVYLVAIKLQVADASAKVAALKPEEFARIVRGATVLHTRREEQTTYADVSVSVIDTELRRALSLPEPAAIGDAPAGMRSILVLPILVTADRAYLWEKENTLHDPVASEVLRQAHGTVMVPAGDFEDLRLIDYQNAPNVTAEELKPMFDRYGAEEIIIALARVSAEGSAEPGQVTLRRLSPKGTRIEEMKITPASATEKEDVRIEATASAIAGAVTQIASSTAGAEQQAMAQAGNVKVHFAYANPRELATMEQAVRAATGVILLEIPSISLQDVDGTVYYTGERKSLHDAITKQGVIVSERGDGWILSLR